MTRLNWNDRSYESGVEKGVLYPSDGFGIAWDGLVSVTETSSGGNEIVRFFDGQKYRSQIILGQYSASIECISYPEIMDKYENLTNGLSANSRVRDKYFNLSYRTDTSNGYKIHLVYNVTARLSTKNYETLNRSANPLTFNWDLTTKPVHVPSANDSSHFIIDSSIVHAWTLAEIEDLLYGTPDTEPRFPTIDELIDIFQEGSILRITDHGDGSWTADGPDEAIVMLEPQKFQITWPSAKYISSDTYTIHSL